MSNYKISRAALIDLEEIWLYTFETWFLEQANRYNELLLSEIEYLAEHPSGGKDFGHVRDGYFRSKVNHILSFIK